MSVFNPDHQIRTSGLFCIFFFLITCRFRQFWAISSGNVYMINKQASNLLKKFVQLEKSWANKSMPEISMKPSVSVFKKWKLILQQ